MTEIAFLDAIGTYVGGLATLSVTPGTVGAVEPSATGDLPAVVLSLDDSERPGSGLGDGAVAVRGALRAATSLDLASPVLPADGLSLLAASRLELMLFHGGLVRADGSEGPLAAQDLEVRLTVPGPNPGDPSQVIDLVLVPGPPQAGEVSALPEAGRLTFGEPLPVAGAFEARYFVGQWQRTVERLRGTLRLDVLAGAAADAASLSADLVRALAAPSARDAIDRLVRLVPTSLGSVGAEEPAFANAHRRTARFAFEYERTLDRSVSSGGLIGRVPVDTELTALMVDAESGAINQTIVTEAG